jgi:hypothetical protein
MASLAMSSSKTAVVYYTKFGHSAVVAQDLARRLDAELMVIEEARPYPLAELARSIVVCHFEIRVKTLDFTGYDRVVICTPIWMQQPACPTRTFLRDARLSGTEVDVLFMCGSGQTAVAEKTVRDYLARQDVRLGTTGVVLTGRATDEELRRAAGEFAQRLLTRAPLFVESAASASR